MGYRLGVDLGTTFTSAAVFSSGWPTMVGLGNRAMQIPSVLFLKPDGEYLVGEAAERRGATQPDRVVREFKRRLGDQVPILVGGSPQSPQALQARLLEWVVATVSERQGSAPDSITLTYPANWGPYKQDLLQQTIRMADLTADTCTEPEAAAMLYAARNVLADGECVAVYDLGGGTFDAAVLRKSGNGFTLLGHPEGIEQLGGIDFDEAVFQHVISQLQDRIPHQPDEEALTASLSRLRRDCVEAKEALSTDTETVVPVALPGLSTSVRLIRTEFEDMIRPSIADTMASMRRALRSAHLESTDLAAIVLTGGSSRIPLVSQQLSKAFDRPLALDTHPKHDVALGAAIHGVALPPPPAAESAPPVTDGETMAVEPSPETSTPAPPKRPKRPPKPQRPPKPAGPDRSQSRPRRPLVIGIVVAVLIAVGVVAAVLATHGSGGHNTAGPPTGGPSSGPVETAWPATTMLVTGEVGSQFTIYRVVLAGGTPTVTPLITSQAGGQPHQPVIAPDRHEFIYLRGVLGDPGAAIIRTFKGAERPLLGANAPCKQMYRPAFSLDGLHVAMICSNDPAGKTFGLYSLDLATGKVVGPMQTGSDPVGDPTWSGDGRIIFLQHDTKRGPKTLYSIDGDGNPTSVRQLSTRAASRPDWCAGHGTLFIDNLNGNKQPGQVGLLTDAGTVSVLPFGDQISSATWSPDCRQIALVHPDATSGTPSVFIASADGTGAQTEILLPGGAAANQPAWGTR